MNEKKLVTVIIPAFNAEGFIQDAVKSCINQTYRPLEVIVVNDGSTDLTAQKVRTLFEPAKSGAIQMRVIDIVQNKGAANALGVGVSGSNGEYVCWLSADDMFINRKKTERQIAHMMRSNALWSYYREVYQGSSLSSARFVRGSYVPRLGFLDGLFVRDSDVRLMFLFFRNPINGSSVMIKRDCFEMFGSFDPIARNVDLDGDLWMRYSLLGLKLDVIGGAPVFYREHPNQTSKKKQLMLHGNELTRMRMLLTLEKTSVLENFIRKFTLFFPIMIGTGQYLARPYVSEFLFSYILSREKQFNKVLVKFAGRSLRKVRNHPNYLMLDRDKFMKDLGVFMASQEFKRFIEILYET